MFGLPAPSIEESICVLPVLGQVIHWGEGSKRNLHRSPSGGQVGARVQPHVFPVRVEYQSVGQACW